MKGSVLDVLLILIVVLTLGVFIIVGEKVLDEVHTVANETGLINITIIEQGQDAMLVFDAMMPLIMVGLLIAAAVMAFMIPSHPVLIIPSILVVLIVVVIAAQLANVYNAITTTPELSTQAAQMTFTNQIMSYLPTVALIMGIVIIVAMFIASKRPMEVAG